MDIIIYLLESSVENAKMMIEELNHFAKMKNNDDTTYEFCHVPGTSHQAQNLNGRKFTFYDDGLFDEAKNIVDEARHKNVRVGFLVNPMLTEDDLRSWDRTGCPNADLLRKLYSKFGKTASFYLIAPYPGISSQCNLIMGEDFGDKVIIGSNITRYHSSRDIDKMFSYFGRVNLT